MLSNVFLGLSLIGAEWVLYLLLILSVVSVALMIERAKFYREASRGLDDFREQIRKAAADGKWSDAAGVAESRVQATTGKSPDLESGLAVALLNSKDKTSAERLTEIAHDSILRAKLQWDRNLAILATIGNNAPFIGLFGTVLGIIKAFHDLSLQAGGGGIHTVTAGISEALVATAVGLLVAIPAVIAFNLFQRKVKTAIAQAEALRSFLIGKMAE